MPALLRQGAITSRLERGVGEDEGRVRLVFFHGNARLTVVADEAGRILRQTVLSFGSSPLPSALRRP